MTFDPTSIARDDGMAGAYHWFTVAPSEMYPPSIQDLIERGEIGEPEATLAITPHDQVTDYEMLKIRASTLERARLNFLHRLIEQHGDGVGMHITNEPDWRL